jgi:hypothetical protein
MRALKHKLAQKAMNNRVEEKQAFRGFFGPMKTGPGLGLPLGTCLGTLVVMTPVTSKGKTG